jgi:hypothetical protein
MLKEIANVESAASQKREACFTGKWAYPAVSSVQVNE